MTPDGRAPHRRAAALGRQVTLAEARSRTAALRGSARVIVQAVVAATAAYWIAGLLGHANPFFAPIAAVATVAISLGQRRRRAAELLVGNAIGILLADLLVSVIGSGVWQLGVVVALALCLAVLAGGGPILIMQSVTAAVLVITVTAPGGEGGLGTSDRFVDALLGGGIGLLVAGTFLPPDPARTARAAIGPVLAEMGGGLHRLASAVRTADPAAAGTALTGLRASEPAIATMQGGLAATRETVRLAPWHWQARGVLATYALASFHLDHALRNARVLARQVFLALDRQDAGPTGLADILDRIASTTTRIAPVLSGEAEPEHTWAELLDVARWSAATDPAQSGLFAAPIRVQVRLIVHDLLQASGMAPEEATDALRAIS